MGEEDFFDFDLLGENFLDSLQNESPVPPADRKVFDDQYAEPIPLDEIVYNEEQTYLPNYNEPIRIPSMDCDFKWSPKNPVVTLPNTGHRDLAEAVSKGETSISTAQLSILEDLKYMTYQQSLNKKKEDETYNWIREDEITDRDVICERGGKSNRHAGTKRYRGMVEQNKPKYQGLTAKIAKTNLSKSIIAQIQNSEVDF